MLLFKKHRKEKSESIEEIQAELDALTMRMLKDNAAMIEEMRRQSKKRK